VQKSFRARDFPVRAGNFTFRAANNRFVRPFSRPCAENSFCADYLPFRARQLPFRAGKNPSVRPFSDLCGQKAAYKGF
jgi:hypothetical protein